jgi:hypothetical protein
MKTICSMSAQSFIRHWKFPFSCPAPQTAVRTPSFVEGFARTWSRLDAANAARSFVDSATVAI